MARKGSQPSFRTVLLIGCEAGLILGAIALAVWLRFGSDARELLLEQYGLLKALLITSACQFCLYYADLYDLRAAGDRRELFVRTLQALGAASLVVAMLYFLFPALIFGWGGGPRTGRGVSVIAAMLVIVVTIGWRMAFVWATTLVGPRERVLIVGTNEAAIRLAREIFDRRAELGVVIVGFVDPDPAKVGQSLMNHGVIGSVDDIPALVRDLDVDRVVVSLADARGKLSMDRLLEMRMAGVEFAQLPSVYEEYTGKIAIDNLRPSWLIFSDGFAKVSESGGVKRIIDIVGSALLLVMAQPAMILAGLAIKATSPGPILYNQQRVGMNGRIFTIHKFRSMKADAEATTGAVWATPGHDSRVTKVGAFLRRSRIDELPQLWNVLRGDMSLVGPRPERPEFVSTLTEQIPFYGQRHAVRPGLTGWAQVRYAYGASVEDAMEKLQYRPVLHQEPVDRLGRVHHLRNPEDGRHAKRVVNRHWMPITLPRHAEIWLPGYLRSRALARREASGRSGVVDILFALTDHYEPLFRRPTEDVARRRVDTWLRRYPAMANQFRDADGRPPQHTFFYPIEEYRPELLDRVAALCRQGYGEIEVHLHHDRDNAASLRNQLQQFTQTLHDRHGLLTRDASGKLRYGFIHGNWALGNSLPDGRWCGVDDELSVLRETGCYADFTLPSAPSAAQTRTVNTIYYAAAGIGGPRSHDAGERVAAGTRRSRRRASDGAGAAGADMAPCEVGGVPATRERVASCRPSANRRTVCRLAVLRHHRRRTAGVGLREGVRPRRV